MTKISDGHEIESRQQIHQQDKRFLSIYGQVLAMGELIDQGYLSTDPDTIKRMRVDFDLPTDFEIDTLRLRKHTFSSHEYDNHMYVLAVKSDKPEGGSRREVEFRMNEKQFRAYWPLTWGRRVQKKRLKQNIMGYEFEIDAFTDRLLLIAECEVKSVEDLPRVPMLGLDITDDKSMTNKKLAK
jgi:CYTH domain-containing protein